MPVVISRTLSWRPPLTQSNQRRRISFHQNRISVRAFQRSDINRFARDAWRRANDTFELLIFEAKKTAERVDRRYSLTRRLNAVAQSAADRYREIDRELEIGIRWRSFSLDFSRNWPRYKKQISDFLDTPLGRSFATLFFLWFALSGWLFRILVFATWILPLAGPLLIGTLANNLVIKGACPACKRQFLGYKNQIIRCSGCGNTVWKPEGDFFTRDGRGNGPSKSDSKIIDVEFEEK